MFRKRKTKNDDKEIQNALKELAQTPFTQDDIADSLIFNLSHAISLLEGCLDSVKSLSTNYSTNISYCLLSHFDLFELVMNTKAITDDIESYIRKPLKERTK